MEHREYGKTSLKAIIVVLGCGELHKKSQDEITRAVGH